jgi:hypothetical protein
MNEMKKVLFYILVQFLFISAINAQEPEKLIEKFFNIYRDSGVDDALDNIFSTNEWMIQRSKDDIDNVKVQLKSLIQIIGEYYGNEIITQKSIGESFKLYSYLIKYDRQPIRFTFIFYKSKDTWKLYNFQYDQNLADELEESAKAYRLKENIDY